VAFLIGHATGKQTYRCTSGKLETSSVPTADLVFDGSKLIVHHSEGPTWTAVPDGSAVSLPKDKAPIRANSPDPVHDIPWLLVPVGPASTNPGVLTGTTFIQRVNTKGGVNPTPGGACVVPLDVDYTADYYFWKAAGQPSTPGKPGA
jgi:hypothetical protein